RGRLEKRAREEKAKESNKPGAQKCGDAAPNQPATSFVGGAGLRPNGTETACGGRFGRANGRSADILGRIRFVCVSTVGSGRFRRLRFWFDRFRFRRRRNLPLNSCAAAESAAAVSLPSQARRFRALVI